MTLRERRQKLEREATLLTAKLQLLCKQNSRLKEENKRLRDEFTELVDGRLKERQGLSDSYPLEALVSPAELIRRNLVRERAAPGKIIHPGRPRSWPNFHIAEG